MPGSPGYAVSDDGLVANLKSGRVLEPDCSNNGAYPQVHLHDSVRKVHKLVALAFLGPGEPGQIVRHLNDKPWDNRLANLAWGTEADNKADAKRNQGERWPWI